jgi:hypothetical protein
MGKSFYGNGYHFDGHDAHTLSQQAAAAIHPIFQEWVKKGYSPREISHMLVHVVLEEELDSVLFVK